MFYKRLSILVISLLSAGSVFADVYKWTDERGVTHYTQYKPLKYPSELVDSPPPAPKQVQDINKPFADQINQRGQERKKQQALRKEQSVKGNFNAQQCKTAKGNLSALQAGGRVTFVDNSGETISISDDEKQARIAEAKKQIQFYCE